MAGFERKLTLWRLLRSAPEGMGLKALAERLGVSKNTVQRDLDELSSAGIPVREHREGASLRFWIGEGGASDPGADPGERGASEDQGSAVPRKRQSFQVAAARPRPSHEPRGEP